MSDRCTTCLDAQFGARIARHQLTAYRRGGASKETRRLVDLLTEAQIAGASVLDVGAGIGAAHGALLERGASRAVSIDASRAFEEVAQELAGERGYRNRVTYHSGDFADIANDVDAADVVVLDKVICCYPDMNTLVSRSAERARRLYAAVYPRDGVPVRVVTGMLNAARGFGRSSFRSYIHRSSAIERVLEQHGFRLRSAAKTVIWRIVIFERKGWTH